MAGAGDPKLWAETLGGYLSICYRGLDWVDTLPFASIYPDAYHNYTAFFADQQIYLLTVWRLNCDCCLGLVKSAVEL